MTKNNNDKSSDKIIKNNKSSVRTTSTFMERKNSVLSSNTSSVSQNKNPIIDLKSATNEKSNKNTISPKDRNINITKNNIFDKITKQTNCKIDNKFISVNSKRKLNVHHFETNNIMMNEVNPIEIKNTKPILKIKNFFEATKVGAFQNNKPVSDRFSQNIITKIFNNK